MYAVIELVDQDILGARYRESREEAIDLALAFARENGGDPEEVRSQLEDEGYWDQGDYRIAVVNLIR